MPRVAALAREELSEFEPFFELVEQNMGFVPNSMLTMGRAPEILRAFAGISASVLVGTSLDPGLRQLVAFVSSSASGCRYCQAHTSHTAERVGVSAQKVEEAFEFETSPLFSAAERAALRLARDASLVPNEASDAHFAELREHYDEKQIVELVAVISLFGWLNRWNDTMGTELESSPLRFGESHLAKRGWQVGRHAAD